MKQRGVLRGNGLEWTVTRHLTEYEFEDVRFGVQKIILFDILGFTFEPEDEILTIKRSQLKDFNRWNQVKSVDLNNLWSWLKELSEKK